MWVGDKLVIFNFLPLKAPEYFQFYYSIINISHSWCTNYYTKERKEKENCLQKLGCTLGSHLYGDYKIPRPLCFGKAQTNLGVQMATADMVCSHIKTDTHSAQQERLGIHTHPLIISPLPYVCRAEALALG